MSHPVDDLDPQSVWKYFERIRRIPHGSRNEAALAEAVTVWAKEAGCAAVRDAVGNVLVRVPASQGREKAPVVVLQGHLDMVCEKNTEKVFDFDKEPISFVRDGEWLKADGTTLGADNGIGVAIALSLMEDKVAEHGPLELLFTIDEETGLNGANGLEPGFVTGRLFANLDSEEEGVFYVGCSGGRDSLTRLPIRRGPIAKGHAAYRLELRGLRGGHSGLDVVLNRGNAIRLLARTVLAASESMPIALAAFEGGDKHNAIPREAWAVVTVPVDAAAAFERRCGELLAGFRTEFAAAEPELSLSAVRVAALPADAFDAASTLAVARLVLALPHGVIAMSRDLPGLVESSSNVARLRVEGDAVTILCSTRSSNASALEGVIAQILSIGALAGAEVTPSKGYPGWQPNMESPLLAVARGVWSREAGAEAKITAIHAGLECGIIGEKYPGIDMISFGPTIRWPHSPAECVSIPTVGRVAKFTRTLLRALAGA
jgi:dipeptidase D